MQILITGDFCPINSFSKAIEDKRFVDEVRKITKDVDLSITNLECPLIDEGLPIKKTGPALKAPVSLALSINQLGFNLVTLANNHIMDYGSEGLKSTFDVLKKNKIPYVGAGRTGERNNLFFFETPELKVSIINFCENEWSTSDYSGYSASGFSEIEAYYVIKEAKSKSDKVIVIHHGGHEMYQLPSPRMKEVFRFLIDCGADAVVNHHTHCVSGFEIYNNKPIFYSLGNFLFDNPKMKNSVWNYGLALKLKLSKTTIDFDFIFFEQFNSESNFRILKDNNKISEINKLNQIIESDELLGNEFKSFVNQKKKLFNSYLEPVKSGILLGLIYRGIIPSFWHKRKRFYLKNLISCESHSEIINEILKNETSHI